MNINNTIKAKVYDFIGELWSFQIGNLEEFLSLHPGSTERRDYSIDLIRDIMTATW